MVGKLEEMAVYFEQKGMFGSADNARLAAAALAKPASGSRIWTIKGWIKGENCQFTFEFEAEYLRFMASKPAVFEVSDIEELSVSTCDQALISLSSPASSYPAEAEALPAGVEAVRKAVKAAIVTCHDKGYGVAMSANAEEAFVNALLTTMLDASPAPAPAGVEGWKLVPIEPTREMLVAAFYSRESVLADDNSLATWRAMLSAAPSNAWETGNG
jgi:hypothetical protein